MINKNSVYKREVTFTVTKVTPFAVIGVNSAGAEIIMTHPQLAELYGEPEIDFGPELSAK